MKLFNKRKTSGLVAAAAIVLTTLAMGSPAHAATTYTPSGGPGANFVGNSVSFTATAAGQTLTCSTFNLAGTIVSPGASRAIGANGGNLGSLTSSGCTNPIAGSTTVTPTGTWGVTITGDEVGSVSPARLTNVVATVSAAGCTFNVGGVVNGSFNDSTQVFTPVSGASGLTITSNPSGFLCPILGLAKNQTIEVGGSWTNTPPSGSTNLLVATA
ncbi:MAG: hypothetical protein P1U38_12600 [Aeromicrobium sp.]|uniref:hypothetical protein n=1 Tax=Aeromicrobium sp. TaxID=1871063 RepID=UPI002613BB2B|nr:hypothetical protein [Aeromicrobium sp.]MDF1705604.1 hypothetical protein [Aeromicrobium sp.]